MTSRPILKSGANRVSCHACRYFYVTWENDFPYGCRAMGFKGKALPSVTVFQSSGRDCHAFEPKRKYVSEAAK